ncbi:MAG TPA: sulfatase-like hydrolase/transferase [Polyangiaceae bacterium]|nr:sulfatase-like hydrolase/transferase [Polyangiaceae bacterium]
MHTRVFSTACFGALLALAACDKSSKEAPAPAPSAAAPTLDEEVKPQPDRLELIDYLARCEVRHRGLSLDVGTEAGSAHRGFRLPPFDDIESAERDGKVVAKVLDNVVSFDFWLEQKVTDPFVEVSLHAGQAKRMSASLGDRRLGSVKLVPGQSGSHRLPAYKGELAPGRHVVTLRFSGRPRGVTEPHGELFWLRLGVEDDLSTTYAAPTLRNILNDVAIDNVPKRSLALKAPAAVRCPVVLAPDAKLHVDLGFWGSGVGKAAIRIITDDAEPVTLVERKVSGGGGSTWIPVALPLGAHSEKAAILELRALDTNRGGRVVFGDPAITRVGAKEKRVSPTATTAIIVLLSGIDRRRVPPWGPKQKMTALSNLSRVGTAFSRYRTPTTVPGSVAASMLTGLPPHAHAMEDPAARPPKAARLISEIVKESSGRTAMFTGAPTTFKAFGFDNGWDTFVEVSPVTDAPAAEPLKRARAWLESELGDGRAPRRFLFVHSRGAHPPWDVPKEEAARLPPPEYSGVLDPRRGGIILSRLRQRRSRSQRRLDDVDWQRLRGLEQSSLLKQDEALAQLITTLKEKGEWDSTLLIVAGDVPPGEGPEPPFDPAARLAEEHLYAPLWVHFPGRQHAGTEALTDVTSVDVALTVMHAFGLKPPVGVEGNDLFAAAAGLKPLLGRVMLSTLADHYAARLGQYQLTGTIGQQPKLCRLDVDPACLNDVFDTLPIAGQATWMWTFTEWSRAAKLRRVPREPASIDPDTGAALTVWGDI